MVRSASHPHPATDQVIKKQGIFAEWGLSNGSQLSLLANLASDRLSGVKVPPGEIIYRSDEAAQEALQRSALPPWSVAWFLRT
jgi:hypothetical protein